MTFLQSFIQRTNIIHIASLDCQFILTAAKVGKKLMKQSCGFPIENVKGPR